MTTISLIVAVLKFLNLLMGYVDREQLKKAGKDELLAELLAGLTALVADKKALREKIDAMSDDEVDRGLRDLEPK